MAVQFVNGAIERFVAGADDLELGEEHQPLGADLNTGTVAGEKGDVPGFFQVCDHPADSGLGIAQLGGCPGDASGLDGFEISDVLLDAHDKSCLPDGK